MEFSIETDVYYNNLKEFYRMHCAESFLSVRAKVNCSTMHQVDTSTAQGNTHWCWDWATIYGNQKGDPKHLGLVRFLDEEEGREFMFLISAMKMIALQVVYLYKDYWQIKLFFKRLKQHLKIKKLWSTTENAVRKQVCSASCAYCLVDIVQHDMRSERKTYGYCKSSVYRPLVKHPSEFFRQNYIQK